MAAPAYAIICGSPRATGVSDQAAGYLRNRLGGDHPGCAIDELRVCELDIHPCIGCDRCRDAGRCFMQDDMGRVMDVLSRVDELFVVSPVYFAGPPAQFKALLDRLQPHYWLGTREKPKRPAHLLAVGEGKDPHGYDPLATCVRSALAVAGFRLQAVSGCLDGNVRGAIDALLAASGDSAGDR